MSSIAHHRPKHKRQLYDSQLDLRDLAITEVHATGAEAFLFGEDEKSKAESASKLRYEPAKTGAEYGYRRLLGTLKRLNNCPTGDHLNQQWVLHWAANYLRLIDIEREEASDAKSMRQQLRKIAPLASATDIDGAAEYACNNEPAPHDARRVGINIDLRFNRWAAAKFPKTILPRNRTDEQIATFYRERENRRARKRREAAGAKPRRLSNVALARTFGVERRTIARWIKAGILDPDTGCMCQIRPAILNRKEDISPDETGTSGAAVDAMPDAEQWDITSMTEDMHHGSEDNAVGRQAPEEALPAAMDPEPMSPSDSLIEIDRQLCDPDIADDWRQELLGMRRELSTAAARAVLERHAAAQPELDPDQVWGNLEDANPALTTDLGRVAHRTQFSGNDEWYTRAPTAPRNPKETR